MEEQISVSDLHDKFPGFIGRSIELTKIKKQIVSVAESDVHVLILGESGTGKELAVNMLHKLSKKKKTSIYNSKCRG